MKDKHVLLKNIIWIFVLLLAIAFIVFGCAAAFGREEWDIVLSHAVNICFECIGLG